MNEPEIFSFREDVLKRSIAQKWDWRFGNSSVRRYLHIDIAALRSIRAAQAAYHEGLAHASSTSY